jgi:hypothetical protein
MGWKEALTQGAAGAGQGFMYGQMGKMFGGGEAPDKINQAFLEGLQRPAELSPAAAVCTQFGGEMQPDGRCLLPGGEELQLGQGEEIAGNVQRKGPPPGTFV